MACESGGGGGGVAQTEKIRLQIRYYLIINLLSYNKSYKILNSIKIYLRQNLYRVASDKIPHSKHSTKISQKILQDNNSRII